MYRPDGIRTFYNGYGQKEWNRLEKMVHGIVKFEVTFHILEKHLPQEGHILDAGGGPGRYAIRLAQMGYEVFLLDISEEQLRLAERRIDEAGIRENVTAVKRLDVCDMSEIPDAAFDAVLFLGGTLSYRAAPAGRRDYPKINPSRLQIPQIECPH